MRAKKQQLERVITALDLCRSKQDCYRIEDEICKQSGITANSTEKDVRTVLGRLVDVPVWCEPEAWQAIKHSFISWSAAFGDLRLFTALRYKKGD